MSIELNNVTLGYENITPIKDLSFTIPSVGIVSVNGASGCGKSTLLKGIARIITPISGEIINNGHKMSIVFQENRLIESLTARENITLVGSPAMTNYSDTLSKILSAVELTDFSDTRITELSGGMQKRVAIARALLFGGDCLILDEPFEGLDYPLRKRIAKTITDSFSLIIIASHSNDAAIFSGEARINLEL